MRPSAISMKLPGCGSPENWWWRYMQPKKKRKMISPTRSRVSWSSLLDGVEARAGHELRDDHPLAREEVITSGTTMNGWPRKMRASERWCWASSS